MAGSIFRVDTTQVRAAIKRLGIEDIPIVVAYTLTKTGQDIKAAEQEVMSKVFDRPTRFTLNSLMLKPATKRDLQAVVEFKDGFGSVPAWRYLGPQVAGGGRQQKSFERALVRSGLMQSDEFAVPGKAARLDASGNMRGGEIVRILSQVGAAETRSGYQANMTAKSKPRNTKRAGGQYFVLRGAKIPSGIYMRKGKDISPVIIFVKGVKYQARFPFYETAARVFDQRLQVRAVEAWDRFGNKQAVAA